MRHWPSTTAVSEPTAFIRSLPRDLVKRRCQARPGLLLGSLLAAGLREREQRCLDVVRGRLVVPDVEQAHRGVGRHLLAIAAHRRERGSPRFGRREAVAAGGDHDARRESLDVPLPRPGQRLVEVVRVEDERPFRRGEQAEVRDVRVAARLDGDVAARRGRQVERHHGRGSAVERERRLGHASVTQREKILEPVRLLREDDRDGIPSGCELQTRRGSSVALPAGPPGRRRRALRR